MAVFGVGAALPLVLLGLLSRATLMRVRASLMSAGKLGKGLLGAAFIGIGVAIVVAVPIKGLRRHLSMLRRSG